MVLLIYIDESGQPHQIDEGPYVLASVAINEDSFESVVSSINTFIDGIQRDLGIQVDEIHTKQLVKGNGIWKAVPMSKRAKIFQRFAEVIASQDLILNIVAAVKERPGIKIANPYSIRRHLIKTLVERLYLTPSLSNIALAIFDSNTVGIDVNIRKEFEKGIKESLTQPTYRLYITFSDSKREPPIQIADYVAYLMRHILMKQYKWAAFDFEKAFLTIEQKIRKCPNKDTYNNCGLKIWEIRS